LWHIGQRTRGEIFKNKCAEGAATESKLGGYGRCNRLGDAVGNEGDFLIRLDAQAGEDSRSGAGSEFSGIGLRQQAGCGCGKACDDDAPLMGIRNGRVST